MNALAARRPRPATTVLLLILALVLGAAALVTFATRPASASSAASGDQIAQGKALFQASCASCHGINAQGTMTGSGTNVAGPALAGVGAAAVDFQVGTGRMPMAAPSIQAPRSKVQFSQEQIYAMAAYIASLAPGPAIPTAAQVDFAKGNAAVGGEIFRVNCAMCHNFAGSGGALTRGKYAPSLAGSTPTHIYEAMLTGPQSMPIFSDSDISVVGKRDVIAYLKAISKEPTQGGSRLGSLGPVSEGLFAWVFGLGLMVAAAVWLGKKAA